MIRRRLRWLIRSPLFWMISLWGHACILVGASVFYQLEFGANPHVTGFLDCLTWAVGTVTTVGGDPHPVTTGGKILSIMMMMGGAIFLWSYMALFIGIIVEPELGEIQREVSEMQHELKEEEEVLARLKALVKDLEDKRS